MEREPRSAPEGEVGRMTGAWEAKSADRGRSVSVQSSNCQIFDSPTALFRILTNEILEGGSSFHVRLSYISQSVGCIPMWISGFRWHKTVVNPELIGIKLSPFNFTVCARTAVRGLSLNSSPTPHSLSTWRASLQYRALEGKKFQLEQYFASIIDTFNSFPFISILILHLKLYVNGRTRDTQTPQK